MALSQFAIGEEKAMASWLVNLWRPLKRTDVYSSFKGGIIQGLLYQKGLFDNNNARQLLKKFITTTPKRKVSIGTCNLKSGLLKRYKEDLSLPDIIEATIASSSIPTIFPYSTFDSEIYVDGSAVQQPF